MRTYKEKAEYWENVQLNRFLDEIDAQDIKEEQEDIPYNDDYDEILGEKS